MLLDTPKGPVLFDHCGRPDPRAGVGQAGFATLLGLAQTGRACVKLSSLTKCSNLPYPYPDAWPYVEALLEAYTPRALVWASDWPFLRAPDRIDYDGLAGLTAQHGQMILEWYVPVSPTQTAATAEFYLGALDIDGNLLGEPHLLFSGTLDKISWTYGPDEINAQIDLIGAPPIVEAQTGQRYTAEGQKRKYAGDKGLDFVASLATLNLTWGGNI